MESHGTVKVLKSVNPVNCASLAPYLMIFFILITCLFITVLML